MSDLHRHNPELAEAIDRVFYPEPGVDQDADLDTVRELLREDIATISRAALRPADGRQDPS